ncbi:alpha/beta hydrolase [Paenibacillus sp. GSMTC-2017]|uniref:alpha/beta hydrolase n=1 Tax=Paenibacillus sp. GSMTC-2017 TaxID=2794350 RepID=UPI0018D8E686|nr:alpha/beta hydrolase [Paenibacillus sp. GSMTC-2017]MBH5319821.1 alpha/beta hydrolase [Paenibacillus sp. GSMTC-2017]
MNSKTVNEATHLNNLAQEQLNFVLIHGAWADVSFWDETAASLRQAGHTVHVPEYAGHGPKIDPEVTHDDIIQSVVNYFTEQNLQHIVLVGHSFGGTIIAKVAEFVHDRISRLVFFDAFVPKDGESLVDQMPEPVQQIFHGLSTASGNNTITLPFPLFRETFANRATAQQARAIYDVSPTEPAGPLFQKLDLKKFYSLEIPKSYLFLTEDIAFPPAPFAWHPAQSSNLGMYRLIVSDGDHVSTVHTHPDIIAEKLVEAGRD